eukprot:UN13127
MTTSLVSFSLHLVSSTDCDASFECQSQTITDDANCFGYGSCHSTSIQTENIVHCDGEHSCHAALIDTSDSRLCRSVASCHAALLYNHQKYIVKIHISTPQTNYIPMVSMLLQINCSWIWLLQMDSIILTLKQTMDYKWIGLQ